MFKICSVCILSIGTAGQNGANVHKFCIEVAINIHRTNMC